MEALRIESLTKSFGGVLAVHNVSFTVEAGERLAIIGPNGAGKTTLFNLISGQLYATSGRVVLFGKDIGAMAPHRRAHLAMARSFQLVSLFLDLSVTENVLLALQGTKPTRFQMLRPIIAYEELFIETEGLLKSMDLWERRNELAQDISYGEQRKLELALSLASKPKVLLLDEPNCGLEPDESAGLIRSLRDLESDVTVLLVAHDMDLVFGVAERIIVLHYGEIIAEGTREEIQTDSRVKTIYMGIKEDTRNAGAV